MQLLKVAIVHRLYLLAVKPKKEILAGYDRDVFRFVDQYGAGGTVPGIRGRVRKSGGLSAHPFPAF